MSGPLPGLTPGLLDHGLHWSLVTLGALGAGYLLLPQLLAQLLAAARPGRPAYRPPTSIDEHEQRVLALRAAVEQGRLGSTTHGTTVTSTAGDQQVQAWSDVRAVVVCSSMAAAVVHAAVFPHHLLTQPVVGTFFALVALAQLAWPLALLLSAGTRLLRVGAVGNLLLVALWAWSRTLGLPGALADGHDSVGTWDLAAVIWELVVVGGCLVLLLRPASRRPRLLSTVGRRAWVWAASSTTTLLLITMLVPHER